MPRIPEIGNVQDTSAVPTPAYQNPDDASIVPNAIAGAASKVSGFALDLLEKRKKAADNNYAFKTYVDDYQAINEYSNKLKLEVPEDGTGYKDKMTKFLEDRRAKSEGQASSDEGLQQFREKSAALYKGAEMEATNFENTTRAKYYVKSMDESANKLASSFLSNPDYTKAREAQHNLEIEIDNNSQTHFVDPATREKLKQGVKDSVSMSVYDGLDAQERYHEQIRLLKNTDSATDIFEGMDAEKRGSLLRRAESGLRTKMAQSDADLKNRVADVVAQQEAGVSVDAGTVQEITSRIATSGLKPFEKEKFGDAIKISGVISSQKEVLLKQPINKWDSPEALLPMAPDGSNARIVLKARAALSQTMKTMATQAQADPLSYAMKASPELNQSYQQIDPRNPNDTAAFDAQAIASQTALGLKPRLVTEEKAQQAAQTLMNSTPDDAVKSMMQLKANHGRYAPQVFAEIAKSGKLPADVALIGMTPNAQSAAEIVQNIKAAPQIKEAFETQTKIKEASVVTAVDKAMENYSAALSRQGTGTLALTTALKNQVNIEAKKQMLTRASGSLSEAVDAAVTNVVEKNFAVVQGANSHFMMPKYDGNGQPLKADTVEAFVKAHSDPEGFAALDVAVPKDPRYAKFDSKAQAETMANFKTASGDSQIKDIWDNSGALFGPETGKDRFYSMLKKNSFWTPSPDNTELILAYRDNGKSVALRNNDGQVISKSYHDITYDMDDRTLSELEPTWKKFFKSNTASAKDKK